MKKLLDLEDRTETAKPIGRPRLVQLSGKETGVDYISALGCKEGVHDEDRYKLDYEFLHKIEKNAPSEADAFSASDFVNVDSVYYLNVAKAVQYYKQNNLGN